MGGALDQLKHGCRCTCVYVLLFLLKLEHVTRLLPVASCKKKEQFNWFPLLFACRRPRSVDSEGPCVRTCVCVERHICFVRKWALVCVCLCRSHGSHVNRCCCCYCCSALQCSAIKSNPSLFKRHSARWCRINNTLFLMR